MNPFDALRTVCIALARGVGGPEGIALGAACLALTEANERKRGCASGDCLGELGASMASINDCADRMLMLERREDPDCSPFEWDR